MCGFIMEMLLDYNGLYAGSKIFLLRFLYDQMRQRKSKISDSLFATETKQQRKKQKQKHQNIYTVMLGFILAASCFLVSCLGNARVGRPQLSAAGREALPYTGQQSSRMMSFAAASYCCGFLGHGVEDWSCSACQKQPQIQDITVCKSYLNKDANAFVAYDPLAKAIIVAFAGTDPFSIQNYIDDIDFFQTSYPACASTGCKVHEGFYKTYNTIRDQIWNAILELWYQKGDDVPVHITGHSMGGALATHCAIDMVNYAHVKPTIVYTYGQPRVGNEAFAAYYDSKVPTHWRVTHARDPVPHLPLVDMHFKHVVREVFYEHDSNGTYVICDGSGEDDSCSNKYWVSAWLPNHLSYMGFDLTANSLSCKLP